MFRSPRHGADRTRRGAPLRACDRRASMEGCPRGADPGMTRAAVADPISHFWTEAGSWPARWISGDVPRELEERREGDEGGRLEAEGGRPEGGRPEGGRRRRRRKAEAKAGARRSTAPLDDGVIAQASEAKPCHAEQCARNNSAGRGQPTLSASPPCDRRRYLVAPATDSSGAFPRLRP